MIRTTYASIVMLALLVCMPLNAVHAVEEGGAKKPADSSKIVEEGDGFAIELGGDPEEEGMLQLFVKDTSSQHALYDPSASELNRISPAAGFQLHFEF